MASSCCFVVANNYFSLNELLAFKSSEPWLIDIQDFLRNWLDDDPDVLAHSSGSTGEPKSILLSKKAMKASAQLTNNFFSLNQNSKALLCLSCRYIAGKMMLVRALEGAYTLFLEEPSSCILQENHETFDFAALVPMQVEESFDKLKNISRILVGGASLKTELEKKIQNCPSRVYQSFGMTETVSHIALRAVNGSNKTSTYHCLPNIVVEQDKRNCLRIFAPMLLNHPNEALKLSIQNTLKILTSFEHPKAVYFLDSFVYNNAKLLRLKTIERLKSQISKQA